MPDRKRLTRQKQTTPPGKTKLREKLREKIGSARLASQSQAWCWRFLKIIIRSQKGFAWRAPFFCFAVADICSKPVHLRLSTNRGDYRHATGSPQYCCCEGTILQSHSRFELSTLSES